MDTAGPEPQRIGDRNPEERRVAPLELFFDLVFVFAITQVTAFLSDHLTWSGMVQGLALLAVLWWAWVSYSWLTNNAVRAEEATPVRLVVLAAMAAMLVASLAVPDAFGEAGLLFGGAYFVVRLLHLALYTFTIGDSPEARRARVGGFCEWLRPSIAISLSQPPGEGPSLSMMLDISSRS